MPIHNWSILFKNLTLDIVGELNGVSNEWWFDFISITGYQSLQWIPDHGELEITLQPI